MTSSRQADILPLLTDLHAWFVRHEYKGLDPYQLDEKAFGLMKRIPFVRTVRKLLKPFHSHIPQSAFASFPPMYHAVALAFIIEGNSILGRLEDKQDTYNKENEPLLDILIDQRSKEFTSYCWGPPFEWGSDPRYPRFTPAVCMTAPVGLSLFTWYDRLPEKHPLRKRLREVLERITPYFTEENGFEELNSEEIALYYTPADRLYVYNSNIMAAAYLYRMHKETNDPRQKEMADKITTFVLRAQAADGSWIYADNRGSKEIMTIDNRHTGFVLESLVYMQQYTDRKDISEAVENGYNYYKKHLLTEGRIPKWSPEQTYPVDIHDVGQSIITLSVMSDQDQAADVIQFARETMYNGTDAFYYKLFANGQVNKTVFIRWGQAWMYRALAMYAERL